MSDLEKAAWWMIGVAALTVVAYVTMFAFLGHQPAVASAFALLALAAVPAVSRRQFRPQPPDERDREIAARAVRTSLSVLWIVLVFLSIGTGFIKGWDSVLTVPVWMLAEAVWFAVILVLGVQAVTTVQLYRGGPNV